MAIRFGVSSTVENRLPRYSNFWDGTAVYNPFSPTGSYDALATYTVGSGGISSISFSGIPNTYSHLQIRFISQDDRATYPISEIKYTFNSDTGSNYSYHQLSGDGGSIYPNAASNTAFGQLEMGGTTTGGTFGAGVIDILDYSSSSKYKTVRALAGEMNNSSVGGYYGIVALNSGLWRSTSAITSLTFSPRYASNFLQYTQFALYGVK